MKRKINSRTIAINGIVLAFFLLASIIPFFGYIIIGPIELTLMHIILLIGMYALYFSLNVNLILSGTIYGFLFGISSWICSMIYPNITTFIFMNPLFSVVPRIIDGFILGVICFLIETIIIKKRHNNLESKYLYGLYMFIGWLSSSLNTALVLLFIYLIGPLIYTSQDNIDFFNTFSWIILLTNYLPETILAIAIFPPINKALLVLYS